MSMELVWILWIILFGMLAGMLGLAGLMLAQGSKAGREADKRARESEEAFRLAMMSWHLENKSEDRRLQRMIERTNQAILENQKTLQNLSALTGMVFERVEDLGEG